MNWCMSYKLWSNTALPTRKLPKSCKSLLTQDGYLPTYFSHVLQLQDHSSFTSTLLWTKGNSAGKHWVSENDFNYRSELEPTEYRLPWSLPYLDLAQFLTDVTSQQQCLLLQGKRWKKSAVLPFNILAGLGKKPFDTWPLTKKLYKGAIC